MVKETREAKITEGFSSKNVAYTKPFCQFRLQCAPEPVHYS